MKKKKIIEFFKGWTPLLILWLALFFELKYMHSVVLDNMRSLVTYEGFDGWSSLATAFDVSVIVLLFSLLPFKSGRWIGIPLVLGTVYVLGNALYSKYIVGYMPMSSWLAFEQLGGVSDSVLYGMTVGLYILLAVVIAVAVCAVKFLKSYPNYLLRNGFFAILTLLLGCFFFVNNGYFSLSEKEWMDEHEYNIRYYRESFIAHHGILYSTYIDSKFTNTDHRTLSDDEQAQVADFIHRPAFAEKFDKPKNILFVIVESLITAPLGETMDGIEVTPTLNSLMKEGVYCPNMSSEVQQGASSDGQFIYFTGLLPRLNGVTVWDYLGNQFQGLGTLAKEQGYETLFLNCSNKTFWKQNSACLKYGEDYHYSVEDYKEMFGSEYKEPSMHDDATMEMACKIIEKHKDKPFFLTMLTYSTHMPYVVDYWKARTRFKGIEDEQYRRYIQKLNFADYQLGVLFDRLKQAGLYDDMLIVVTSDHIAPADFANKRGGVLPILIRTKGLEPKKIDEPLRQLDIYPTMMNLMGYIENPYMGLGRSVFDLEAGIPRADSDREKTQKISDMILEGDYFRK